MKDLTGQKWNRLTAIRFIKQHFRPSGQYRDVWLFRCECGKEVEVFGYSVTSGRTKSCGCYRSEVTRNRSLTHGLSVNYTTARFLTIWRGMKQRCENPNYPQYKDWGGRGVKVLWKSFEEFRADMEPTYSDDLTLDRWPDKNGNYCKENCRWATPKEQSRNTRRNKIVTHNGESKTLAEWCEILSLNYKSVWGKMNRGVAFSEVLTELIKSPTPIV